MFPPIQCSKSSYFTQWLISEYLNRINDPHQATTSSPPAPPPPPPPPPPPTSPTNIFSSKKNFKHLFNSPLIDNHHHNSSKKNGVVHLPQPNNNDYKNNTTTTCPKNIEFIQLLALNALEFTAPIYSFINKNNNKNQISPGDPPPPQSTSSSSSSSSSSQQQSNNEVIKCNNNNKDGGIVERDDDEDDEKRTNCKCPTTRSFIQLSGHPGSFAPAGPNTIWKKMPEDDTTARWIKDNTSTTTTTTPTITNNVVVVDQSTIKELINKLDLKDSSSGCQGTQLIRRHSIFPIHNPTTASSSSSPPPPPTIANNNKKPIGDDTTPITVFFNSEEEEEEEEEEEQITPTPSSSSSSSSTTRRTKLLQPKIYNIPTHLLPNETIVYRKLFASNTTNTDPLTLIIPKYVTETCYNSQMFLELEDLLTNFCTQHPTIMDVKLGTRTFLESEVKNSKARPDLYRKLVALDPNACSEKEHAEGAVTKLNYMMFRERQSSSCALGFRIEGVKIGEKGSYPPATQIHRNFKTLQSEPEICEVFSAFCKHDPCIKSQVVERLTFIRDCLESSDYLKRHEVIGSSLLFIHDDNDVGIWLIDFAKTFEVEGGEFLSHRGEWVMGNREDGLLFGVDSILRLFTEGILKGG